MITKIRNNYKYINTIISNVFFYLRKTTPVVHEFIKDDHVLVNLSNNVINQSGGRFAYLMCLYFEQAGYNIIFKTNFYNFLILHPYKKLLLNKEYNFVRHMSTSKNSIVFIRNGKAIEWKIYLGLNTISRKTATYSLPFPMHPVQVSNYNKIQLAGLRSTPRLIKIFFSGNWTQQQYKAPLTKYNVLCRYKTIHYIIENFKNYNQLKLISESSDLDQLFQSKSYQEQIVISDLKTQDEDWLKFLSIADFFIAPPGFKYPWCHNSIEAMSVGTIPILEYNHLFVPELVHLENCICYKGKDELKNAINTALAMRKEEIEIMRNSVIFYYEKHLSPEAIVNRLKQITTDGKDKVEILLPYIN